MLSALQIMSSGNLCRLWISDRGSEIGHFLPRFRSGLFTTPLWPPLPSASTGVTFHLREALQGGKYPRYLGISDLAARLGLHQLICDAIKKNQGLSL